MAKVVEMSKDKKNEKLSYEELEKFAYQLSEQARQMKEVIANKDNEIKSLRNNINDIANTFTRMNFLIEIIKHSDVKFDTEFALSCADEIRSLMTIPEQNEETKEE